jgi:hypothetical protein
MVGLTRDGAWRSLVARVEVGEAIAVDFPGDLPVARRHGRVVEGVPDGGRDLCAGVELRSCRAATGGRIVPQHRILAGQSARGLAQPGELAVLRDRSGLGAFNWLITDVGRPSAQAQR